MKDISVKECSMKDISVKACSMKDISVVVVGGSVYIGRLSKVHGSWRIEAPRTVLVMPVAGGGMSLKILPCIGFPKAITIEGDITHYVPEDQQMVNAYIKQTTNIEIANGVPMCDGGVRLS